MQENKTCRNNDKINNITVNGNLKWFVQGKINNKQKRVMQKKDKYDDVIKKYLQKIDDQRRKLFILRE